MRLTLLNQFYTPDVAPTGQLAASLARHRAALGDQVTVITGSGGYVPESPQGADEAGGNPRVLRLWTPGLGKHSRLRRVVDYAAFYLLASVRMLTLPQQDVVISMTTPPFIAWAAVLHRRLWPSCRLILWVMDVYPEALERLGTLREGGSVARGLRALHGAMLKSVDHVICLDDSMRHLLLEHYPRQLRHRPVTVISNFEEAAQFPPVRAAPEWKPEELNGRGEAFVVLYLGNVGRGHRFETVVNAADRLQGRDVLFLFVGGGEAWGWIQRAVVEMRLGNLVLMRYVPKELTPGVMALARCGLITMQDQALGVMSPSKLHSYLAMGLPVIYIGPEGNNVDEAIRRFGCGVSLRNGDTDGVVEHVLRLARDPNLRDELGGKARRAFEAAYSDKVVLPKYDEVIESLVQTSARG
jgi:colanic acid biosynthesis glycosyl transferase WcaI